MKFKPIIICLLFAYVFPQPAHSDLIEYGSIAGDNVVFSNITETSATTDGPVYGSPTGVGDSISFIPFGFQALSSGGIDFEEGRLSFTVTANMGYEIESIELVEASSFFLFGDDSMVVSNLFGVVNANGSLFSQTESIELRADSFSNQNSFESGFAIQLPNVNQATFVLDSQIFAAALNTGSLASISKDALLIRVTARPVAVPEPTSSAVWAVLGVLCVLRRKQNRSRFCG